MKKLYFFSVAALTLVSANSVFAGASKAADQLALQAPQQTEAAAVPEASSDKLTVIMTEKGKPVRTIYFEADKTNKGNPWVDGLIDVIANSGNNNNNNYPGNHGYGDMNCVAMDQGYEEHWGGHGGGPDYMRSCQECLSIHGKCRYTCSVQQFVCTAQFNPAQTTGNPLPTFTGDLRDDEGSARDSASLHCMQSVQGQAGYCSVTGCNRQEQDVRSGTCWK